MFINKRRKARLLEIENEKLKARNNLLEEALVDLAQTVTKEVTNGKAVRNEN